MKFLRGLLLLFLSAMFIIAPPGGAVCWPLPGGHHLHIGWNDPNGEETLGLTVFTHPALQPVGGYHTVSLGPKVLIEAPTSVDVLPTMVLAWFLPLIALGWLLLEQALFPSPRRLQPETPPPRRAISSINVS